MKRPELDNTTHSQQTDIHASGGFRTRNPSKRSAVDFVLRTHSHMDRLLMYLNVEKYLNWISYNCTRPSDSFYFILFAWWTVFWEMWLILFEFYVNQGDSKWTRRGTFSENYEYSFIQFILQSVSRQAHSLFLSEFYTLLSTVSSLNFLYPLCSLRSSSICLRLLPRLVIPSILPFIYLS